MKLNKLTLSFLLICILIMNTGCNNNSSTAKGIKDLIETTMDTNVNTTAPSSIQNSETETMSVATTNEDSSTDGSVDVDLTVLSATMVYAEVYNMMAYIDDYVGKTVKVSGKYYSVYSKETKKTYFYVLIADAMACCSEGIEFIWDGGKHTYPDEYPPEETEVTITGVFKTYKEEGLTFCYLDIDDIEY